MSINNSDIKIGLALGSGGTRGLAHIGVIEVLEKEGINIDMIAGTSIGSLIGGVYACGVPLRYVTGIADVLEWDNITDVTFPRQGLIKGNKLLHFLKIITAEKNFSDLNIPLSVVSCDIKSGERVVITEGSLAHAIRSSISIPGVFIPHQYKGKVLVDGGLVDRVPVSVVKAMGADVIIAVDIGADTLRTNVDNIFDILFNTFDILQNQLKTYRSLRADIVLQPDLEGISSFDLSKVEQCVAAGRNIAEKSIGDIKKIIRERKK